MDPALVRGLADWLLGDAPPETGLRFAEEFVKDPELRKAYQEARANGESKGDFVRRVQRLKPFARLAGLFHDQPGFSGRPAEAGGRQGGRGAQGAAPAGSPRGAPPGRYAIIGGKRMVRIDLPKTSGLRAWSGRVPDSGSAVGGRAPTPIVSAPAHGAGAQSSDAGAPAGGGAVTPLVPISTARPGGPTCAGFFAKGQIDAMVEGCLTAGLCEFWSACQAANVLDRCKAATAAGADCKSVVGPATPPPPAPPGGLVQPPAGENPPPPPAGPPQAMFISRVQWDGGVSLQCCGPIPGTEHKVYFTGKDGNRHEGKTYQSFDSTFINTVMEFPAGVEPDLAQGVFGEPPAGDP